MVANHVPGPIRMNLLLYVGDFDAWTKICISGDLKVNKGQCTINPLVCLYRIGQMPHQCSGKLVIQVLWRQYKFINLSRGAKSLTCLQYIMICQSSFSLHM